jgi:hypothetical protein
MVPKQPAGPPMTLGNMRKDRTAMITLTTIVIALALSTGTTIGQVLPQPKVGVPSASCPFGYMSSGAFCIPRRRDAVNIHSSSRPR